MSNFIWVFIVIGIIVVKVFIFPEESTPLESFSTSNILNITLGDILTFILSVAAAIFLMWLYLKLKVWHYKKKHPDSLTYGNRFADEEEAMNAFLNPHDPILNPQPHKPKD